MKLIEVRLPLVGAIAMIVLIIYGTQAYPNSVYVPVTGAEISYSEDIQPILDSRCIVCHGVQRIRHGLDLRSYESLMDGSRNGPVIIPGDAENSLLIQKIVEGKMPKRGPKLFPAQLTKLKNWINAGAPNN